MEGRQGGRVAVAAGVAEAFRPDATMESVIAAAVADFGPVVRVSIERAVEIAKRDNNPVGVIPEYYEKILVEDGWSGPVRNDPGVRKRIITEKRFFRMPPP
jgi:hypothetical protein